MKTSIKKLFIPAIIVFLLDRITKEIILQRFVQGESIPVIKGIFHFTRVDNTGAVFGLFRGGNLWLLLGGIIFILLLLLSLRSHPEKIIPLGILALILGGAAGNIYDRIFLGRVIDFLDFRIWPVFNIADSCISIGLVLFIIKEWKIKRSTK